MAKRSRRSLSKKWMPAKAVRGIGSDGKTRVWKWNGLEFVSMRDLIFRVRGTEKKDEGAMTPEVA